MRLETRVRTRLARFMLCALWVLLGPVVSRVSAGNASLLGPAVPAEPAVLLASLQDDDVELEAMLADERSEAEFLRRHGQVKRALRILGEHLDEDPEDARSRVIRARCRADQGRHGTALGDARRCLTGSVSRETRREALFVLAEVELLLGHSGAVLEAFDAARGSVEPARDPEAAWWMGRALWDGGQRASARQLFSDAARAKTSGIGAEWRALLFQAKCQRALGGLEAASRTLIEADSASQAGEGPEAEVLVELADIYFEADRESDATKSRSPAELYRQALEIWAQHEGALLGLYELHRYNWRRKRRTATDILDELLLAVPKSVRGLAAGAEADLSDGQLVRARRKLKKLTQVAPDARSTRTLEAALAWIEHRRDEALATLDALGKESPEDSVPERVVGTVLLELYRFAEGLPFLEKAVARDSTDHEAWTQLGRALANTGAEDRAREALKRAVTEARLRQDVWRDNMLLVLERMASNQVREDKGDFVFAWRPDAAAVMQVYMEPHYRRSKEELARRYGYTPQDVTVEVFRQHEDFSVRSTGFEGFPALGVCFGPVVTAVSPLAGLRGKFSWARTSFHEYSHVIHLGLSNNRCPRWITEGLATWEEVQKNPAWTRNMRRELLDAYENDDLIRVRDLNRAFRGPRILFGYYQGGLLCEMLIDEHGFPPMVRLLEAFDRGLDLDQAFLEVFGKSPEEVDVSFERFVAERIEALELEPRWSKQTIARLRFELSPNPPGKGAKPGEREDWIEGWSTVAWGAWQNGRAIDAEEALRHVSAAGEMGLRARLLRGELALARKKTDEAREIWEGAIADGAEDFRMRIALGSLSEQDEEWETAERHYLAAEKAFPGYADVALSAELALAVLYESTDREDDAMRARERWLDWNAGEARVHRMVARWHFTEDRFEEACRRFAEVNEVDPFSRTLHQEWGEALLAAGRQEEALREFRVALLVPVDLDADSDEELTDEERADLLSYQAKCLLDLGRYEEAQVIVDKALELDADAPYANDLKQELDAR